MPLTMVHVVDKCVEQVKTHTLKNSTVYLVDVDSLKLQENSTFIYMTECIITEK